MTGQVFDPENEQAAARGCLSGFFLPPLAVLAVGLLMGGLLSGGWTGQGVLPEADPQGNTRIAAVFTIEIQHWSDRISRWADGYGLDPNLAAVVMQIESCGDPQAVSRSQAYGLFQVMPYHFASLEDPFDPDTNALRGLGYLQAALQAADGDIRLALAGYNGGISVIGRPEGSWSEETRRYVYWGSGIHADAAAGASSSPRLEEWLQAGGTSLCRQARQRLGLP